MQARGFQTLKARQLQSVGVVEPDKQRIEQALDVQAFKHLDRSSPRLATSWAR